MSAPKHSIKADETAVDHQDWRAHSQVIGESDENVPSFDVTCVIATIRLDEAGGEHPFMAACRAIYEHDNPGKFYFPDGFGDFVSINVPERPVIRD